MPNSLPTKQTTPENERRHLDVSVITTADALPPSGVSERSEFPRLAVISGAGGIGNTSLAK